VRCASSGTRSPVGVPLRLLPSGLSPVGRNSRPGFLGRGRSVRSCKPAPTGGRRPCAAKRALPAPACPSPGNAPPRPVLVPASMMPEAARERSVSFRARAPLSLRFREYPREGVLRTSEILWLVTEIGTNVKCRSLQRRRNYYSASYAGLTRVSMLGLGTTTLCGTLGGAEGRHGLPGRSPAMTQQGSQGRSRISFHSARLRLLPRVAVDFGIRTGAHRHARGQVVNPAEESPQDR